MKSLLLSTLATIFLLACADTTTSTVSPLVSGPSPAQDKSAIQQLAQDIFDNVWSGTGTAQVRRY